MPASLSLFNFSFSLTVAKTTAPISVTCPSMYKCVCFTCIKIRIAGSNDSGVR